MIRYYCASKITGGKPMTRDQFDVGGQGGVGF